jgi:hypothetical protein
MVESQGIDGATVTLNTGVSATTASGGAFSFQEVDAGAYTVTLSNFPEDASFSETSGSATISEDGQVVAVNFTGSWVRTSVVLGWVEVEGDALSGITVKVTGANQESETVPPRPASMRSPVSGPATTLSKSPVTDLGTRELRFGDASGREGLLPPPVEEALAGAHADEIEYWSGALELGAAEAPSRSALARYMESLVSRREDGRSLPPLFEARLLGRVDHRVRARGVLAAIVMARGMLAEAGGAGAPES